MKYINLFKKHSSYESEVNGGGVDFKIPNVSYCEDVKDVHYNPYNTVEFYVGEITGTIPQTVKIYTDKTNHVDVQISEGNKWYTYVLPKDKGLFRIEGDSVKKVVVKADISFEGTLSSQLLIIIPSSTIEASFKGSNTSKVTAMGNMFGNCKSLTSLDLSSFDTSNVASMNNMFGACSSLTSLDLSNFNTSKVNFMGKMFSNCSGLTSLDVSGFDTSKVIEMSNMFADCVKLTSLNLSNFNISNVIDMHSMFAGCTNLTSLNLSNFNISNVIDMHSMFAGCTNLISLDISGWNTSKVTNMSSMFRSAPLKEIRLIGCSEATVNKIKAQLTSDGINNVTIVTE